MTALMALLEIVETLVTYSQWRDGCPDCGSEKRVRDHGNGNLVCQNETETPTHRTDPNGLTYYTRHCGRRWIRGEA